VEERPLHHRLLAALALAALIAAGLHCSWAIYTDRADFRAARSAESGEPGASPEQSAGP
jgi:hypothetical protein